MRAPLFTLLWLLWAVHLTPTTSHAAAEIQARGEATIEVVAIVSEGLDQPALLDELGLRLPEIKLLDAGACGEGCVNVRVRMIAASLLVKHLLQPWQEGAYWFWDTLVDADLPNNTMGWQWVAGSGADASPYFRIFNPIIQGKKFDPDGTYIRRWIPELNKVPNEFIHTPWEMEPLPYSDGINHPSDRKGT